MRKLLALLVGLLMMGFAGNAFAQEINVEYAYDLVHAWAEGLEGGSCEESMQKLDALSAEQRTQLRDLLQADLAKDERQVGISALDFRLAHKVINELDNMTGKLAHDKMIEAKLVEPTGSGTVVWYKVQTLDGKNIEELYIGSSTVMPCGYMQELDTPYRMYLRGDQIVKLEKLSKLI